MSPNFALILSTPAWNNSPVKKETNGAQTNQDYDSNLIRAKFPLCVSQVTPHIFAPHLFAIGRSISAFLCVLRVSPVFFLLSRSQSTLTLTVTYGNSR